MGRVRNPCDLPPLRPHLMQTNNVATHGNELPINLDLVPRPYHGKVVIDLHRKLASMTFFSQLPLRYDSSGVELQSASEELVLSPPPPAPPKISRSRLPVAK